MPLRRKLLANFNWVVLANLVAGLINFLALAWFARQLGATVMGDYAVIVTGLYLIAAFLSAGFDQAVIREPNDPEIAAAASVATFAQTALIFLASGAAYAIYFWQTPDLAAPLAIPSAIILLALSLSFFSHLLAAPVAAQMNYRRLSFIRLLSTLAGLGAGMALAFNNSGIFALAARDLVTALVMLGLIWSRTPAYFSFKASREGLSRLARFTWGLWALNALERISLRADYALVGAIFGKETLGIYFVVRGLIEGMLGFIIQPVQTVLYSYYCHSNGNISITRSLSHRVYTSYWILCILLSCLAIFFAPKGVSLLLGEEYRAAHAIVPGLVLYSAAIIWFENIKVLAMAQQRHTQMYIARLAQLFCLLLVFFPLAITFGLFGAGLASGLGALFLAFIATRQLYQRKGWI